MSTKEFTSCPMYSRAERHGEDIDELHNFMRDVKTTIKKEVKLAKKRDRYLNSHMKDEEVHHTYVSESIRALTESVQELVNHRQTNDNTIETLLKDKNDRDTIKEKRDGYKEKIIASVTLAIIYGTYHLFMQVETMLNAAVIK